MHIRIRDIVNTDAAITFDLGVRVREFYGDRWQSEMIEFDYSGIRNVSPSFLSQSISPIVRCYPTDLLSQHLRFINTPPPFEASWKKVQEAATRIRQS